MSDARKLYYMGIGLMLLETAGIGAGVWFLFYGERPYLVVLGGIIVIWNAINLNTTMKNTVKSAAWLEEDRREKKP